MFLMENRRNYPRIISEAHLMRTNMFSRIIIKHSSSTAILYYLGSAVFNLFVLRFYGPVNPVGHVERGQFT